MKSLRQVCAAIILCLAFTVSVSAGDIHNPGVASTGTPSITTTVILTIVSLIYS
jgi:hypothetical protein